MKIRFGFILALAALTLVSLACNAISGLPSLADLPLLQDDFDGDQNWGTGTDADSSVEYAGGGLQFQVYTPYYFVWSSPNDTEYENIHTEVTVQNSNADPLGVFGIICYQGVLDQDLYYFAVTPDGYYAIVRGGLIQEEDFFLTNDDAWAKSDSITPNAASYRLGADCGNGTLTLYVDGKQIDSVQDSTYASGKSALFAWSDEMENGVNVTFDDFVITKLPTEP